MSTLSCYLLADSTPWLPDSESASFVVAPLAGRSAGSYHVVKLRRPDCYIFVNSARLVYRSVAIAPRVMRGVGSRATLPFQGPLGTLSGNGLTWENTTIIRIGLPRRRWPGGVALTRGRSGSLIGDFGSCMGLAETWAWPKDDHPAHRPSLVAAKPLPRFHPGGERQQ